MTIGYVFKAEFFLPENASNYLNILADPYDISTRPITGKKRRRRRSIEKPTKSAENVADEHKGFDIEQNERFEKHNVDVEVIESGTNAPNQYDDEYADEKSWFAEEHFDRSKDPLALKGPQNLGTTRWTIYKGMAAMAERFAFLQEKKKLFFFLNNSDI